MGGKEISPGGKIQDNMTGTGILITYAGRLDAMVALVAFHSTPVRRGRSIKPRKNTARASRRRGVSGRSQWVEIAHQIHSQVLVDAECEKWREGG